MLKELHIENFAIITKASLYFENGVNLITGETGAGKSLLIDALRVAGGSRSVVSFIKTGAEKAKITIVFDISKNSEIKNYLQNSEIDYEGLLYIRRIITQKNPPKNFINDTPVSAAALKDVFDLLIEMHGQFENQKLLNTKIQLDYLDAYSGSADELTKYYSQYKLTESIKTEIENFKKIHLLSPAEIEWKKHQISELSKIKISDEEYSELLNKIKVADKANLLTQQLTETADILNNGNKPASSVIIKSLDTLKSFENDEKLKSIFELLNSINLMITGVNSEITDYLESLNNYICNIDTLQSTVFDIQRLLRKYKINSITDLNKIYADLKNELENIEGAEIKISELQKQLETETSKLSVLAKKLSDKRGKSAKKLEKAIAGKLKNLAMADADFKISIIFDTSQFYSNGCDRIEFLVKTNKGDILKPLKEIASGGEISRIMLALKSVNAETDDIPTIIFDEIDTGISGTAAAKVAEELFNLSAHRQTMCVTHQPAIAALPAVHYQVSKKSNNYDTIVEIKKLDYQSKIKETATLMTGGKITPTSLKSAEELIAHYLK